MSPANKYALHLYKRTVRLGLDRLEGREMPGSFLGELAAVAGFGPLNLRSASTTAPLTALPPAPKPETPKPVADPTAGVVFLPPPTPTKTTEIRPVSPFDALPEFGAFRTFDFGPMVAYNPPAIAFPMFDSPALTSANGTDSTMLDVAAAPLDPVHTPNNSVSSSDIPNSTPSAPVTLLQALELLPGTNPNAPVAATDSITVAEDGYVTFNPLGNDSDPDTGDQLTIVDWDLTSDNGVIIRQSDGKLKYTPDENFYGTDSFHYTVSDGDKRTVGQVNVTVTR
ncbi:MAG: cadherin-like domain-containing protein [Gemmataceae bacterium]